MRRLLLTVALSLVSAALGCSGDDTSDAGATSGQGGAGGSADTWEQAPHTPLPQLRDHGQGVYDHLELVTITFAGDDAQNALVEGFGDWVVTSDYYTQMGSEYGIGPASHLAKVTLPEAVPGTENELFDLLDAHFTDGSVPAPEEHPQAVYVVYIPFGATFHGGGLLCAGGLAYHYVFNHNGHQTAYAIVGDCGKKPNDPNYGAISNASHEIIEAATDPFNAWYVDPGRDDPWHYMYDNEIADMCEYFPVVTVDGYPLARWWSNAAAAKSENPCLPVPADMEIYHEISASPATEVTVPAGGSTTFELTGWTTAEETGSWKIFAEGERIYSDFGGIKTQLSTDRMTNGGKATLTVTVPSDAPSGKHGIAGVYSDHDFAQAWYVGVVVQ